MTKEEAINMLKSKMDGHTDTSYEWAETVRMAIKALEQEPCPDAISRQAVEDKLLKLCNELEGIFADIRIKEVDDCVCGLCEYDCDHGIDGSAFECPGFETDECFKLADEIRHEWQSTKDLPSVQPKPKTGHWIVHEKPHGIKYLECPYCNIWYLNDHLIRNSYCPNCGARMVDPQESEG